MDGLVWLPAGEPEAAEAAARLWAGHVKKNCGDQI
jgi:tRNA dimethylallyltransferase